MQFTLADILKVLDAAFVTYEEAKTLIRGHLGLNAAVPPAPVALPEPEPATPTPEVTEATEPEETHEAEAPAEAAQ